MKILIIDDMHLCILDLLKKAGHEVEYLPEITANKVADKLGDVEGLIVRSKVKVNEELLKNATKIKFIARAGAGTDNLDEKFLEQKGIKILNAPEGNRDAVGDHTMALILGLTNRIVMGNNQIGRGIWDREGNRGDELSEMTVGIYGFGNTGQAVAKRLVGFGSTVLAFDKYHPENKVKNCKNVDEAELLERVDLISFHIPLTYETKGMINDKFLTSFNKDIYLINTSRGEILDHSALISGLKSGKIRGAGLDVFENEKFDTLNEDQKLRLNTLTSLPNVIMTPHVAGWTKASYRKISEVIASKISQLF